MSMSMGQFASALMGESALPHQHHWFELVEYATSHGLAGLLLDLPSAAHAPSWATPLLCASAHQVGERNLHLMEELHRVAFAFERASIPLMALKGAGLNLTVYPRGQLRPMGDLDLLVHLRHAESAVGLLQEIGYTSGAALVRDDFFPRHHYEKEMILHGSPPVRIDLHVRPWRPLYLAQVVSEEAFWHDAVRVPAGRSSILLPNPETLFIHLAAHAAFHGCSRFIWLYDLARVIEKYRNTMNWITIVERTRRWELALAVRNAIESAEAVLGLFVPHGVVRDLREIKAHWRARLSLWHAPRDADRPLLHVACNTLCLRGAKAKLTYIHSMLVPHQQHLGESYPYRHAGWPFCAHLCRIAKNVRRVAAGLLSTLQNLLPLSGAST